LWVINGGEFEKGQPPSIIPNLRFSQRTVKTNVIVMVRKYLEKNITPNSYAGELLSNKGPSVIHGQNLKISYTGMNSESTQESLFRNMVKYLPHFMCTQFRISMFLYMCPIKSRCI
jgi:hypothetical protein